MLLVLFRGSGFPSAPTSLQSGVDRAQPCQPLRDVAHVWPPCSGQSIPSWKPLFRGIFLSGQWSWSSASVLSVLRPPVPARPNSWFISTCLPCPTSPLPGPAPRRHHPLRCVNTSPGTGTLLRALLMNQQRILLQSWLSAPPFPTLDFSDLRADTQVSRSVLLPATWRSCTFRLFIP